MPSRGDEGHGPTLQPAGDAVPSCRTCRRCKAIEAERQPGHEDQMIRVQQEPFDPGHELAELKRGRPSIGGTVMFLGTVRDLSEGSDVKAMTLLHLLRLRLQPLTACCTASAAARRCWE